MRSFTWRSMHAQNGIAATIFSRGAPIAGFTVCLAIALISMFLGRLPWLQAHGMSALTLAILLGIAFANSLPAPFSVHGTHAARGVEFSKQILLRAGIVLYGLRLTFQDVARVGWGGVAVDAMVLCTTFLLALFVGIRLLKLDRVTVLLIGAGSSICGAAAVMAAAPVARAKAEQVVVAVSTVVVFGTLAIFVYPLLFRLVGAFLVHFGIYAGSTIHEVAQVVAAAGSINAQVADVAVITKLVRVMMLAPFLFLLAAYVARNDAAQPGQRNQKASLNVPWFAFLFMLVVALNSLVTLPAAWYRVLQNIDTIILATAMAALGLTTRVSALRQAGLKPLLLGAILFAWLIIGGAIINRAVMGL
jgi:uncharacterized integral membrane protein (TIGR00698 family)